MSTLESYRYSALDESGKKVSGTEKAASVSAAHLMLIQRGLQPIDVKEHKSILKFEITKKTVTRKEIMHFSRQLSVFVEAGIPIMEALEVISEETTDKLLKKVLLDMVDRAPGRRHLCGRCGGSPRGVPPLLRGRPRIGGADRNARQGAPGACRHTSKRDIEARSAVTSALIYPAVVAVMAVVTVIVLATFVLPKFRTFFASLNAKLPLPTRMLLEHLGLHQHVVVGHRRRHRGGGRRLRGTAALTAGAGVARLGDSEASRRGKPSSRRPSSSVCAASSRRWSPPASTFPAPWPSPPRRPTTPSTPRASTTSGSR